MACPTDLRPAEALISTPERGIGMTGGSILEDQYAFRDQMVEALERDLIGPVQEQEVLDENPLDRYLMGVLYPTPKEHPDAEVDDSEQEDPEVDEPEAAEGA